MVFKLLFGEKQTLPPRVWQAPAGQRIYAIGDIHGRLDLLDDVLGLIEADDAGRPPLETKLIFLGDLVDRGPDSRGVVERMMALKAASPNVRLLMGNHEELLIRTCAGDRRSAGLFNRVGGRETLLSYGVDETTYKAADLDEMMALATHHVPTSHIAFFKSLDDWIIAGDYLFVHAGIRPGNVIEEQETSDLRWIRKEFTDYKATHPLMVIHGHTITENIDEQPNRIGIDTGAYETGRLTAIGLEGADRWFIQTL